MTTTSTRRPTISEIKAENAAAGQHFFDRATLRHFGSTVHPYAYGYGIFVTGEKHEEWDEKTETARTVRRYSVRFANVDATIDGLSEFGDFATKAAAIESAKVFAALINSHAAREVFSHLLDQAPYPGSEKGARLASRMQLAEVAAALVAGDAK